jgi:ABC-type transport system substrate-binding protein
MVEHYEVSDDQLIYDFILRDGLLFHDGVSVTSEDVIASLKRWGNRDVLGRRLRVCRRAPFPYSGVLASRVDRSGKRP